jgi:hypothetical protein
MNPLKKMRAGAVNPYASNLTPYKGVRSNMGKTYSLRKAVIDSPPHREVAQLTAYASHRTLLQIARFKICGFGVVRLISYVLR